MYPIMMNLSKMNIVVIGGGKIATRKILNLFDCGAEHVTMIANEASDILINLVSEGKITWHQRLYQSGDLKNFNMVLLCTNYPKVNRLVAQEVHSSQLFNDATNKENSNFYNMPYFNIDEGVVAVSTMGQSCATSKKIRNQLQRILQKNI